MILNCIQCHQDHQISNKLSWMEAEPADYICPDCMVQHVCEANTDRPEDKEEKRRFVRVPVFVPVRVSPQTRGIIVTSALIVDASNSGVCIETKISLGINDKIDLKLQGKNAIFQAIAAADSNMNQNIQDNLDKYKGQ